MIKRINQLQRFILVHSVIYYKYNCNLISDFEWDLKAKELKNLQEKYPDNLKKSCYYEYFKDWEGITGFHLPLSDSWANKKALLLLRKII